jgi:hypothetical protein
MKNYSTVNIKVINGVTYTAYRHNTNPKDEIIVCEKGTVHVRLKEVWGDDNKLVSLEYK